MENSRYTEYDDDDDDGDDDDDDDDDDDLNMVKAREKN